MSLADSLRMDHLNESPDDLKKQVELKVHGPTEEADDSKPDPRDQEQWTFLFEWKDARGHVWRGEFTNKILTIGEQQSASALRARFTGGMPWNSIDEEMQLINTAVAHMMFSLVEKPAWAKDLRTLLDPQLIVRLFDKVSSHENRFFRLSAPAQTG